MNFQSTKFRTKFHSRHESLRRALRSGFVFAHTRDQTFAEIAQLNRRHSGRLAGASNGTASISSFTVDAYLLSTKARALLGLQRGERPRHTR
jgi:hypothetical protein